MRPLRALVAAACAGLACAGSSLAAPPAPEPEALAAQLRDRALAGEGGGFAFVSEMTTRFGARPAGAPAQNRASAGAAERL